MDENNWNGYICLEFLLVSLSYFEYLRVVGLFWGFFSGVMRFEIVYVLEGKLGLSFLVVVGMEDVLGKFDFIGLFVVVE